MNNKYCILQKKKQIENRANILICNWKLAGLEKSKNIFHGFSVSIELWGNFYK